MPNSMSKQQHQPAEEEAAMTFCMMPMAILSS